MMGFLSNCFVKFYAISETTRPAILFMIHIEEDKLTKHFIIKIFIFFTVEIQYRHLQQISAFYKQCET